ncbi:hypothetical protein BSQ44_10890 [Aquibium oceanicum]|uniref:Uncharacterized protein n=1 Tax=Aquibium oceanicum TaxID=1670800 RepID=A0A1L3SR31_9HYPH|nr:hypothetical protein [Aquibium oceanicum]APH71820.1 hypothetical protein BSQ44_10890 [Aquibium oceanicum]
MKLAQQLHVIGLQVRITGVLLVFVACVGLFTIRVQCDIAPKRVLGLNWAPSKGDRDEEERVTEDQIIGVLKEHQAGIVMEELYRKHGISDATFCNSRSRYGGMGNVR